MPTVLRFPWLDRRPHFRSPLPAGHEALVLEPVFRSSGSVRCLEQLDPKRIGARRPAVLAGSRGVLERLAGSLPPHVPSHAVVVLTRAGESLLTESERDALWSAYGVPVFEQILTAEGELAAWECEAHEGYHVPGEQGAECDCGSSQRRVTGECLMHMLAHGPAQHREPWIPRKMPACVSVPPRTAAAAARRS